MSLLNVAKKLNKAYKDDSLIVTGDLVPDVARLGTGNLGFDYALYGGMAKGTISVFSGTYSSGKTLAAAVVCAAYQKQYPEQTCLWVDVENSLLVQRDFLAKMSGLDFSKLLVISPRGYTGEQVLDMILNLQRGSENIGMIVLDSIPALKTQIDLESSVTEDKGMRATMAKPLHKFMPIMSHLVAQKGNMMVIINQVREVGKLGNGAIIYGEPGGSSLDFYPVMKVRFGTITNTLGDKVNISASRPEGADGFRLKFVVTKSKICKRDRGGGFLTFRHETGLDTIFDNLDVAMKYELIHRPNNVMYVPVNMLTGEVYKDKEGNDLSIRGRAAVQQYLVDNPDFAKEYFTMLVNYLAGRTDKVVSLLNEEDLKEIMEQEESVETGKKVFKGKEEDAV